MTSTPAGSITTAEHVHWVLDLAESAGARLRIDGGWAVDALLGKQTRVHGDLDFVIEERHLAPCLAVITAAGFTRVGESGATPWNFLLQHPCRAVLDLHVVTFADDGRAFLGPRERDSAYPAGSLAGSGVIADREVDCVAAPWLVEFHDAYVGDHHDRADVRALCARFDLEIPEQYR